MRLSELLGQLSSEELTLLNIKLHSRNGEGQEPSHPHIKEILKNKAFTKYPPIKENYRHELPVPSDPNWKPNILKLIKDLIGKDITRITLPAYLNQPLCNLVSREEILIYKDGFDRASKEQNPQLRLALAAATVFMSGHNYNAKRRKPMNPLLGQTHEMFWEDLRVISEQVSHHPPVSATFVEGQNYTLECDIEYKAKMTLKNLVATPEGQDILTFSDFDDKIIIKRPNLAMFNLVFGKRFFHLYGNLTATNITTGDTCEIKHKKKPMFGKPDTSCEGWVKDKDGKVIYTFDANWRTHIDIVEKSTGNKIKGLKAAKPARHNPKNFMMSMYSRNAGLLNEENIRSICPTDSRLRSDQRALEYGDMNLARDEKVAQEEAQRARRKQRKKEKGTWTPRWFKQEFDKDAGRKVWKYKGGYFEARKAGEWENIPQIY